MLMLVLVSASATPALASATMQALFAKWAIMAGMIESAARAIAERANPRVAAGMNRHTLP